MPVAPVIVAVNVTAALRAALAGPDSVTRRLSETTMNGPWLTLREVKSPFDPVKLYFR